jgi:hypothetical protein
LEAEEEEKKTSTLGLEMSLMMKMMIRLMVVQMVKAVSRTVF